MKVTGAQALFKSLLEEGVEVIFGYPGGQVLTIYDALPQFPLRHILVRHEQGAVHAADGYARATGKVGVCLATSGPGATNLVTGLATAYMDSTPLVAITGQVPTAALGRDAFQEADLTGITMPITKHNYLVKDPADLPRVIKEAFHIASTGRPGPVLIDIPKDVQVGKLSFRYPEEVDLPGYRPTYNGHPSQIDQAARALLEARQPVIICGGGVIASGATAVLRELAETLGMPVACTLLGLGGFPADHPLALGMLGMHGTFQANRAVHRADVLLAVGTRFADRVTGPTDHFAPQAKVIHVDIDPAEIGKNVEAAIPVVGDAGRILTGILKKVTASKAAGGGASAGGTASGGAASGGTSGEPRTAPWLAQIEAWRRPAPVAKGPGLNPAEILQTAAGMAGKDAIVVTDVGQHQMWAAQHWPLSRPRSFISSGGLGTMGFGLPAAIGAKVGRPDAQVILITGDGSFQMNVQELGTLSAENVDLKMVLFNNGSLGMVRQWQELFYGGRLSQVTMSHWPDFVQLVKAYGIPGQRVERRDDLKPALDDALSTPGPILLDCIIDPNEKVYPMVPPGNPVTEMLMGPD